MLKPNNFKRWRTKEGRNCSILGHLSIIHLTSIKERHKDTMHFIFSSDAKLLYCISSFRELSDECTDVQSTSSWAGRKVFQNKICCLDCQTFFLSLSHSNEDNEQSLILTNSGKWLVKISGFSPSITAYRRKSDHLTLHTVGMIKQQNSTNSDRTSHTKRTQSLSKQHKTSTRLPLARHFAIFCVAWLL